MSAGGRRAVWIVVAVLSGAVAALAWLVTSELGLRWALQRASALAEGRLVIEQAKRTGIGAMTAARVRYRDAEIDVDAREASLSLSVASLLRGRLRVHELRLADLRIGLGAGDGAPAQLPQTLRSPAHVAIESLRVDRLTWVRDDQAIEMRSIALGLAYDRQHYALAVRSLGTPWFSLSGNVRLGDVRPFPIAGRFTVLPRDQRAGAIALSLAGELQALGMAALGSAFGAPVTLKVSLLPFHAGTLAVIDAGIESLDTRAIAAGAPYARLDVDLHASLDREARAAGRLRAVNRAPGALADERLPLVSLDTRLAGSGLSWQFESIALDAGSAGTLAGRAQLEPQKVTADLQARGLNLRALNARLYATALNGPLHVESDWNGVVMQAALTQSGDRFTADAVLAQGRLELREASWRGSGGQMAVRGIAQTAQPYAFQASGRLVQLDPSRFGDYPSAMLNGAFEAKGRLDPVDVDVALDVADSRFRGQPLVVKGRGQVTPDRIANVDVAARLGGAQASVRGGLGAAGDVLKWSVDIPDLRVAHDAAAGRLKGAGAAYGSWREPGFDFQLEAAAFRWGEDMRVSRLSGQGRLDAGLSGRLDIVAEAQVLQLGEIRLEHARAAADGSRERHTARLESAGGGYRVDAEVAGGFDRSLAWQGTIKSLQLRGPLAGGITQPVDVMLSASAARIGPARLQVGEGKVELASFAWQAPGRLTTRGMVSGFPLATLAPLLPVPEALRPLVIGARWDIDATESLNGSLRLVHEAGDVVVPGSPVVQARLRSASIDLRAQQNAIALDAAMDSAAFGTVTARAMTRASMRNGFWGIAEDAPLEATVAGRMPSLAWTRAVMQDTATLEGEVRLDVRVSGSVRAPSYSGELVAGNLRVGIPELGLALREGSLAARLQGQQLSITAMRFLSGTGEITGTGGARLVPGDISAQLALDAKKVTVLSRPDRLVIVSGQTAVRWDRQQLRAEGKLVADRGLIELPPADTPRPSSDVVVVGGSPAGETAVGIQADLLFDLGDDFRLQGRGVSTRLGGTLRVQLTPKGAPVVTGTVRALDGIYSAYGQKLTIQRGTLTFAGPVGNPALDILAVRKTNAVEVGVAIGGTALLPQVRLVSTPPMSDADKLAWLTLGRGLDQVAGNEAAVLQAAAMALLSGRGSGSGSQGSFANRFGLDELSLSKQSTTGEQIVTLGKRFASNVYLGVERGVTGAVSVVKVTYDLSRRWSVQARAGSENAVDLFYTLGFR